MEDTNTNIPPTTSPTPENPKNKQSNTFVAFCKRQDWEDFMMKFLAVFLGIVITFTGNAWISHSKEKREVKAALKLVRDELHENIEIMDTVRLQIDMDRRSSMYLMQNMGHYEECHPDTLMKYCNAPFLLPMFNPSDEALELLKNSSLFQKISDKDLALDIIRAYSSFQIEKENIDFYKEKKKALCDEAVNKGAREVFARQYFTAVEAWNAITSTIDGQHFLNEINISVTVGMDFREFDTLQHKVIDRIDKYCR